MLSLSPFPSVVSTSAPRDTRPGSVLRRKSLPRTRGSLFSLRRCESRTEDSESASGVVIEELPSTLDDIPSSTRPSSTTLEGMITINEFDLSSSFTLVERKNLDLSFPSEEFLAPSKPQKPKLDTSLHRPKDATHVIALLQKGYDPNKQDLTNDSLAPLHAIVRSKLKDRAECLEALLTYGDVKVNLCAAHKMTGLHFAAMVGDMRCVKLLLAFGAHINAVSDFDQTPMNIAVAHDQGIIIQLLEALKGITAAFVEPIVTHPLPLTSCFQSLRAPFSPDSSDCELEIATRLNDIVYDVPMDSIRPFDINLHLESRIQNSFTLNEEELVAMVTQEQQFLPLHQLIPEIMHSLTYKIHNGHKILSLDGGWMRSLIQIEILEQLEIFTGQNVTEIFDTFIGSSSGALIILGLVYGGRSLAQLRQMFFRMKRAIFSNSPSEIAFNSSILNDFIRNIIGCDMRICDVKEPRVLVSAVDKETTDLQIKFFNNFLKDGSSQESVLKVASYVTATPRLFIECDNYVDASVVANNPSDYALTFLQHHSFLRQEQFPISLIVSIGTGVYTPDKLRGIDPPSPLTGIHKRPKESLQRIRNMSILMRNSLLQSDEVGRRCAQRCEDLGIKFFRFNPHLKESVSIVETESRKLINMILRTRIEMQNRHKGLEGLKQYLCMVTNSYTASGGGLGNFNSDAASPGDLVNRNSSSDTSGDELRKFRLKTMAI